MGGLPTAGRAGISNLPSSQNPQPLTTVLCDPQAGHDAPLSLLGFLNLTLYRVVIRVRNGEIWGRKRNSPLKTNQGEAGSSERAHGCFQLARSKKSLLGPVTFRWVKLYSLGAWAEICSHQ